MGLILVIMVIGQWGLRRPLWSKPPAGSTNYYFDPYPPDEILPTPLPNECACWGCCCLFPGIGGYLGYKFFKEKPDQALEKCLSIGMSYGLGSVLDGIGHLTESEMMPDPIVELEKAIYWVNQVGVSISYSLSPSAELEIGFGYMWGKETGRISVFDPLKNGQVPHFTSNSLWEISCYNPTIEIKLLKNDKFTLIGFEFYLAKAINYEVKAYSLEKVTIITKGLAPGGYFGFGLSPRLTSFLQLEFSITGRYGLIRNPDYWGVEEEVVRSEDFFISFSGLYLNLGVKYNLLTRKEG